MSNIAKMEKGDGVEELYVSCHCGGPDHLLRIIYIPDSDWGVEFEFDLQLSSGSFWYRLKTAIKWLFKSTTETSWYGTCVEKSEAKEIAQFLTRE